MLMIQLIKAGRDTMDLLSGRNLQSRHQIGDKRQIWCHGKKVNIM